MWEVSSFIAEHTNGAPSGFAKIRGAFVVDTTCSAIVEGRDTSPTAQEIAEAPFTLTKHDISALVKALLACRKWLKVGGHTDVIDALKSCFTNDDIGLVIGI